MKKYLLSLPDQIVAGYQCGARIKIPASYRKIRNILFCGMGGSAISGDILSVLMHDSSKVPFVVNRSGEIPNWTSRETLAIFSSYSGNTEETLEAFKRAKARGAKIVVVTTGGKLARRADKLRYPVIKIPTGFPPRAAIGFLTCSVIPVLTKGGWLRVRPVEINALARHLRRAPQSLARRIAHSLYKRPVVLYGYAGIDEPVLRRWRTQLAENSKTLVSHHVMPEMLHNEIEGWSFPRSVTRKAVAVFFVNDDEKPVFRRKREKVKGILRRAGAGVLEVGVQARAPLPRIFDMIYLGDWVSFELARLNRVNPVTIPAITAVKNTK